MKLLLKFGLAIICILIVAFCTFVLLTTLEPDPAGPDPLMEIFQWAFVSVGLGCISIIVLVFSSLRPSSD